MTLLKIRTGAGRAPSEFLERLDAAIGMVRFQTFDIWFDEARSFHIARPAAPFVLTGGDGVIDAIALRLAVKAALEVKGFDVRGQSRFTPHMTLAYDINRREATPAPSAPWKAYNLQLIESWVGQTRYVQLASWPLLKSIAASGGHASRGRVLSNHAGS